MSKMRGDVCLKTLLKAIPFLLLCLLPQIAFSSEIHGRVAGVCDGGTITVLDNGHTDRVRLHGIDCPEKDLDLGARAKQLTRPECWGRYSNGSGSNARGDQAASHCHRFC
jgi:endonuclease YncB( thermonuclease family)